MGNVFQRQDCGVIFGGGAPCNSVLSGDGFYVSFLSRSRDYGCATTALVNETIGRFFILDGDHRAAYGKLMEQGYGACLEYFQKHLYLKNKFSD